LNITRRAVLLSTASSILAPAQTSAAGKVAFHYSAIFSEAQLSWYARFKMLVTGGVLSREQSQALQDRGCKLVAYEWASGFYPGDSSSAEPSWQKTVMSHPEWLLNSQPVGGGAAAPGRTAFWYDFSNLQLVDARAAYLAERIRANRYAGLFLDTPGFEYLPAVIQQAFTQRVPGVDYNQAQGAFFAKLRQYLGSGIIFLNQGYRHAEHFLPYADYDLTESYFVASTGTGTQLKPFHDPATPWQSILTPMEQLVMPASQKFPRVRFVHLGYAAGTQEQMNRGVRYNFAVAKLWNHDGYLVAPELGGEQGEVYFNTLGKPVTRSYVYEADKRVAWREYEGGVVAINCGPASASILNGRYQLLDPPNGYVFLR
jgi:hypothetical protein